MSNDDRGADVPWPPAPDGGDLHRAILVVRGRLTLPPDTMMAAATELGRNSGLGPEWVPECLDAALAEIVISGGDAAERCGFSPLDAHFEDSVLAGHPLAPTPGPSDPALLSCRILVDVMVPDVMDHPDLTETTLPARVLQALRAADSPTDFGIEIVDIPHPASAHARIQETRALQRAWDLSTTAPDTETPR